MAFAALSEDEQRILSVQLGNVLEPRLAVNLSSASRELREATQAQRQQLRTDHEAAAALCLKVGMRGCKELREVTVASTSPAQSSKRPPLVFRGAGSSNKPPP